MKSDEPWPQECLACRLACPRQHAQNAIEHHQTLEGQEAQLVLRMCQRRAAVDQTRHVKIPTGLSHRSEYHETQQVVQREDRHRALAGRPQIPAGPQLEGPTQIPHPQASILDQFLRTHQRDGMRLQNSQQPIRDGPDELRNRSSKLRSRSVRHEYLWPMLLPRPPTTAFRWNRSTDQMHRPRDHQRHHSYAFAYSCKSILTRPKGDKRTSTNNNERTKRTQDKVPTL